LNVAGQLQQSKRDGGDSGYAAENNQQQQIVRKIYWSRRYRDGEDNATGQPT